MAKGTRRNLAYTSERTIYIHID